MTSGLNAKTNNIRFISIIAGLIIAGLFLTLGIFLHSLPLLVIAALLQGTYYGINNHRIFHSSYLKKHSLNEAEKINSVWVHIVSSLTGVLALYFLLSQLNLHQPSSSVQNLRIADVILLLLAILAYSGLLPMTLWFLASSGEFLKGLLEKLVK
jgi:hypothetical protein